MSFLILVRHGQSTWNLEKRFTGWVDVDLTEKGKLEAEKAGLLIKNKNININFYYSSLQLRANHTLELIQKTLNDKKVIWFNNVVRCGSSPEYAGTFELSSTKSPSQKIVGPEAEITGGNGG